MGTYIFYKIFKLMLVKLKYRVFSYVKVCMLKEKKKSPFPRWGSPVPVGGGDGGLFIFPDGDGDWNED